MAKWIYNPVINLPRSGLKVIVMRLLIASLEAQFNFQVKMCPSLLFRIQSLLTTLVQMEQLSIFSSEVASISQNLGAHPS